MGKLLDQVIEIHASRMNMDLYNAKINNKISSINNEILKIAEKGNTYICVDFETFNTNLCTAKAATSNTYTYLVNELNSVPYIIQKLKEYYITEEFDVVDRPFSMSISWTNKLLKSDNNE